MTYTDLLQHNPVLYLSLIFIFGLLVGSFLNVIIYRLPLILKRQWKADCVSFLAQEKEPAPDTTTSIEQPFNLIVPRSRCPHCGHLIAALENIPILSFLFLGGRCRECKTPISIRYPLVEFLSATLTVIVAWKFGFSFQSAMAILLTWSLICLSFIDYDHQYLPDNITLQFSWRAVLEGLARELGMVTSDSREE